MRKRFERSVTETLSTSFFLAVLSLHLSECGIVYSLNVERDRRLVN